jgi:hypothetical protein
VLSLIPVALMAAKWILSGLSAAGIAFFSAYVIVAIVLLIEATAYAKIFKK